MIDLIEIYNEYLLKTGEEERKEIIKMEGYFSAGGAGSCYLKQMFKYKNYEPESHDTETLRMFRLGTLVHEDIERAVKAIKVQDDIIITTEEHIVIEDLKVRGYLDICITDHKNKTIDIIDVKTLKSYTWTKKFGRVANRDTNPTLLNELQLGTYALAKQIEYPEYTVKMYLVFYKKEDSRLKIVAINDTFMESSRMYWEEFQEFRGENDIEDVVPGVTFNVPVYKWECNRKYCKFTKYCSSEYIK